MAHLSLAGTTNIPVKEVQQAEMDSAGALQIISTPIIGVPGGSKFQAVARLTVHNTCVSGVTACQVHNSSTPKRTTSRILLQRIMTGDYYLSRLSPNAQICVPGRCKGVVHSRWALGSARHDRGHYGRASSSFYKRLSCILYM